MYVCMYILSEFPLCILSSILEDLIDSDVIVLVSFTFSQILGLCLLTKEFERKCKEKKIEGKSRSEEKV